MHWVREGLLASGIWDRFKATFGLAGQSSGNDIGLLPAGRLRVFFKSLAKKDRQLVEEIVAYIGTESQPSVLLKLQKVEILEAWRANPYSYHKTDDAGLFHDLKNWRVDQLKRYGEVLAVLHPITYDWGYFGTKKSPDWLRHVITEWIGRDRKDQPIDILRALAEFGELGMPAVLDVVFGPDATNYGGTSSVSRFGGVSELLQAEHVSVVAAMQDLGADIRSELVAAIGRFGLQSLYMPMLLDAAIGSSKKVRGSSRKALAGSDGAALSAHIEERYAKASPAQRVELVEVVALTLGPLSPALLEKLKGEETSPKVLAAFDRAAGATASQLAINERGSQRPDGPLGYNAVDGTWVEVPELGDLPQVTPLDRDVLKVLDPAVAEFNRFHAEAKKEGAGWHWHWTKQVSPRDRGSIEKLANLAEGTGKVDANPKAVDWLRLGHFHHPAIDQFYDDPRLSLRHLVRLAIAVSHGSFYGLFNEYAGAVGHAVQRRLANGADFRMLFELWNANGGEDFLLAHLTRRWYHPLPGLDVPLWQALVDRFAWIDEALGIAPQSHGVPMNLTAGLELLGRLPKLPERYRSRLLLLANDSSSHVRNPARELLKDTPDIGAAIALQLEDGRQDVRALAADWLARRNEREQAPAIRRALTKDKSDVARAAMISALQRLGEDVSEYFDPANLVKEAQVGVAKLKTKALDWFPFDRLPTLHWDDGTPLDPILPRWWLLLSCKLKQPGGNALMNLWLKRLAPGDAHKLGWMVLTCWIDEDVRSPTEEEANAYAAANVDAVLKQYLHYVKISPQSADYWPTDRAVVFARLKADKSATYLGSATDSKGILALCSHVNGADAAQRVRSFLKDHGARVSQAKALLDALAANTSSAALQVVLTAANRSKQKSVEAHAAQLIETIADQNGWTAGQLADRTVPTGGFDSDGTLDLDCGEGRTYQARLDENDLITLFNADGREVKALPGPRMDDERPTVEAAKKLLSNARKEVKQVLSAQTERLKEAMCLQRGWPREDWESFIAGHPIVGRVVSKLVWQGLDAEGNVQTLFRPLGDGSFTDSNDGDVDTSDFAEIRLAHSSLLDTAQINAWRQHLSDYSVEAPFDQFGRQLPQLAQSQAKEKAIKDREGWMIETFKLRGIAGKLGYQRGAAQDGGWFVTYEKSYREAGLQVEIEFTGSPLPEENRIAALQTLTFRKLRGSNFGVGAVALGDVPSVLLAECWRDLHEIAEKGTGFDPEWSKKAYL